MNPPDLRAALTDGRLSVRAYNALLANGVFNVSQLTDFTDAQLSKFRSVGTKSLAEIRAVRDAPVDSAANAEIRQIASSDLVEAQTQSKGISANPVIYEPDPQWQFNIDEDVAEAFVRGVISRRTYHYLRRQGCITIRDVAKLAAVRNGEWSGIGRQGQVHIRALLASSRAVAAPHVFDQDDLGRLTRRTRSVLSPEQWLVVVRRCSETLREIALDLGVSRERIRQIESKGWREVAVLAASEPELLAQWRAALEATAVAESRLFQAASARSGDLDSRQQMGHILLRILGAEPPRSFDGQLAGFWTFHPAALVESLQRLVAQLPCEPDTFMLLVEDLAFEPDVPVMHILQSAHSPVRFIPRVNAWVRASLRDRDTAWMILQRKAAPMKLRDLANGLGVPSRNLDAMLRRDDRFLQLLPSGLWTISDWNLHESEYRSSLEAVTAVLAELGPQHLAQLARNVIARYPVTPAAVAQCLTHESIGRWPNGKIDLSANGAPRFEQSEPRRPPSVFPEEGGRVLAVLQPVTRDLLRGSGLGLPRYVSWALGMQHAPQDRTFKTKDGEVVTVRKRIQGTTISTLRGFAERLGAEQGCALVIRIDTNNDTASVELGCQGACSHRQLSAPTT